MIKKYQPTIIVECEARHCGKNNVKELFFLFEKLGYKGLLPKHRGDASNLISKLLYQKGEKLSGDIIPYLIYGEPKTTKRSWRDSLD